MFPSLNKRTGNKQEGGSVSLTNKPLPSNRGLDSPSKTTVQSHVVPTLLILIQDAQTESLD